MRTLFQDCTQRTAKRTVFVSVGVHGLVLGALIVLPLISYAALPETRLLSVIIPPPPLEAPPPPVPPAPTPSVVPERVAVPSHQMVIPEIIPDQVPLPTEEPPSTIGQLAEASGPTVAVPSGATGVGGVPRGLIGTALPEPPKPEPLAETPSRPEHLRVSEGIVLSKAIRKVQPQYPPLAKRARVDGAVRLEITIDEQGNVSEILVREGHRLLIEAAKEAVAQWKFSPTLLSGQPVKVKATISIVFTLN